MLTKRTCCGVVANEEVTLSAGTPFCLLPFCLLLAYLSSRLNRVDRPWGGSDEARLPLVDGVTLGFFDFCARGLVTARAASHDLRAGVRRWIRVSQLGGAILLRRSVAWVVEPRHPRAGTAKTRGEENRSAGQFLQQCGSRIHPRTWKQKGKGIVERDAIRAKTNYIAPKVCLLASAIASRGMGNARKTRIVRLAATLRNRQGAPGLSLGNPARKNAKVFLFHPLFHFLWQETQKKETKKELAADTRR